MKLIEDLGMQEYGTQGRTKRFGIDAYNKEQEILKEFKEYKYVGEPILSSGNTELFTHDILSLDIKDEYGF